jgi:hypothetical protein
MVKAFRVDLEKRFKDLKTDLQEQAKKICDNTDNLLQQQMPRIWQERTISDVDSLSGEIKTGTLPTFITEVEILLWKQLALLLPQLGNYLVQVYLETLESSRILLEISQSCCDTVATETLQAKVQTWINEEQGMRAMLGAIASRLPLTIMVDPDKYFNDQPNSLHILKQIREQIDETISQGNTPQPQQFQPLTKALREHYQSFILNDGIEGLLNLYRYEMIVIQGSLIKLFSDIFDELGDSNDPKIQERILSKYPDSTADQVRILKRKLTALEEAQGNRSS